MVSNITIFGLNNMYAKVVGKQLADELDMFFADVMELLTFDFINLAEAENVVGRDYILKKERSKIRTLSTYENTVICCDYRSLNTIANYNNLKSNSIMIYLKLNEKSLNKINSNFKDESNFDLFSDVRMGLLENKAHITCDVSNLNVEQTVNLIIKSVQFYYNNKN